MATSQPVPDASEDPQERSLGRRLAWRRIILEVLGIGLITAGLMVNWPPADDASLPATRPFVVLLGLLLFAAGLALERRSAGTKRTRSENV